MAIFLDLTVPEADFHDPVNVWPISRSHAEMGASTCVVLAVIHRVNETAATVLSAVYSCVLSVLLSPVFAVRTVQCCMCGCTACTVRCLRMHACTVQLAVLQLSVLSRLLHSDTDYIVVLLHDTIYSVCTVLCTALVHGVSVQRVAPCLMRGICHEPSFLTYFDLFENNLLFSTRRAGRKVSLKSTHLK